jgi:hypothetical protein
MSLHSAAIFETTLINLRVLQSLEPGHRLDTTRRLFRVYRDRTQYIPVWFHRWWTSQNRTSDINRIRGLYHQALQCLETCDNDKSTTRMKTYIAKSIDGLKNLQTTYSTDLTMQALIDIILDQISKSDQT